MWLSTGKKYENVLYQRKKKLKIITSAKSDVPERPLVLAKANLENLYRGRYK